MCPQKLLNSDQFASSDPEFTIDEHYKTLRDERDEFVDTMQARKNWIVLQIFFYIISMLVVLMLGGMAILGNEPPNRTVEEDPSLWVRRRLGYQGLVTEELENLDKLNICCDNEDSYNKDEECSICMVKINSEDIFQMPNC